MSDFTGNEDPRRQRLLDAIDRSSRGKHVPMIKTLMAEFGFNATYRVRQSSLAEVTRKLSEWGIDHEFPGGVSSLDYIRLFRMKPERAARVKSASTYPPPSEVGIPSHSHVSPFTFAFEVGETLAPARSEFLAQDLFASIWSSRPTLLFIDAPDEFFALAGGIVAAVMRRRQLMTRNNDYSSLGPIGPDVLSSDFLKRILGQNESGEGYHFPSPGAVYLLRDDGRDGQDDELVALAREMLVPQTFRLRARFASTAGDPIAGPRAVDDMAFQSVLSWVALYAGVPGLAQSIESDRLIDLASLFAEATQLREALIDRATLRTTDPSFRASFESTEHMVLKNIVATHLRARFPEHDVHIEQGISRAADSVRSSQVDEDDALLEGEDRVVRARPDVRCPGRVSVEVETLRSSVVRGSNPFFALEQKLRRKLTVYEGDHELWLVVPSDVALLAEPQLHALVRNLNAGQDKVSTRCAIVDAHLGEPVFIAAREPVQADIRLVGASWREQRKGAALAPLTWSDVAGYSDLKKRLHEDVLAPLLDPARYAKHKLSSSNGLLLYGLPGCGKSLIGRVLAGEADLPCRRIVPSDLTGPYLGESTMKTRELFDWALKQPACILVIDELDAIAPQRSEGNMHTDEKRQVNELLAQLDRIAGKPIVVVATTNYFRGIDSAIRRSGRFDTKLPIFPPNEHDRTLIFDYYLGPTRLAEFDGLESINTQALAHATPLFAPADIRAVVEGVARRCIVRSEKAGRPRIGEPSLLAAVGKHARSIQAEDARRWIAEAEQELGSGDPELVWLQNEVERAYAR